MKNKVHKYNFAVCIDNHEYPASLEKGKIYRLIADADAESHGYVRVIDESGEDYMYSTERFFPIRVPGSLEKALVGPTANKSLHRTRPAALQSPRLQKRK